MAEVRAALATAPAGPDRVNEDFAAVSVSAAVLLDGAGIPPGLESGCAHGVAWFARTLGTALLAEISAPRAVSMTECLADSIRFVRRLHQDSCDLDHPESPSATVVAARVLSGRLEYLVLADSALIIHKHSGGPLVITDDREHVAGGPHRAARDATLLGTAAHREALRGYVETIGAYRNQPGGFWVAAADPGAAAEALTGRVPLADIASVILASDGATRLVGRFGLLSWPELVKIAITDGPEELILRTRAAEAGDPDGRRWPRGKARDDATVICCRDLR
jgi:hypothetical protein